MLFFFSTLQLYFYLLVQSREVKQGQTWMSYSSYFQCQGRFSRTRIFSLAASTTEVIVESHDKCSCECWIMKPFPLKCINTVYILWKKTKNKTTTLYRYTSPSSIDCWFSNKKNFRVQLSVTETQGWMNALLCSYRFSVTIRLMASTK